MMTATRVLCALIAFVCVNTISAESTSTPVPSPSPAASESPAATIAQSVTGLSAQRAAAERSKIYRAGADYGRWLDGVAKNSGNAFLQRPVFDRGNWTRLLASAGALALLEWLPGWSLLIVRSRAGAVQSARPQ